MEQAVFDFCTDCWWAMPAAVFVLKFLLGVCLSANAVVPTCAVAAASVGASFLACLGVAGEGPARFLLAVFLLDVVAYFLVRYVKRGVCALVWRPQKGGTVFEEFCKLHWRSVLANNSVFEDFGI